VAALRVLERRRSGAPDQLARLLHDDDAVVAAAARRVLARHADVALRLAAGALLPCPHGWRAAMADSESDVGRVRYCASCDARVTRALDGDALLDGDGLADQPVLTIESSDEGRHRFAMIGGDIVIGSDVSCDVAITSAHVAARHLTVRHLRGRFWVEAEAGATFTCVRGMHRAEFVADDSITFGAGLFTLTFGIAHGSIARETLVQGPHGTATLIARASALAVSAQTLGGVPSPAHGAGSGVAAIVEDVTRSLSHQRVLVLWSNERGVSEIFDDRDFLVLSESILATVDGLQLFLGDDGVLHVQGEAIQPAPGDQPGPFIEGLIDPPYDGADIDALVDIADLDDDP
jgi:hypothetical protein